MTIWHEVDKQTKVWIREAGEELGNLCSIK